MEIRKLRYRATRFPEADEGVKQRCGGPSATLIGPDEKQPFFKEHLVRNQEPTTIRREESSDLAVFVYSQETEQGRLGQSMVERLQKPDLAEATGYVPLRGIRIPKLDKLWHVFRCYEPDFHPASSIKLNEHMLSTNGWLCIGAPMACGT